MRIPFRLGLVPCLAVILFTDSSTGEEKSAPNKTEVAGRTLDGWTADLDSSNDIVRLRAVKSLRPFGAAATDALLESLNDDNAGVRYWAASHLGDVGARSKLTVKKLQSIESTEKNPGVAMAIAYALCRLEHVDGNIDLLIERLEYPERGMACSAAEFLGKLGPAGKPAVVALEKAFRRKGVDYHVRGASQNALRKINPDWKP